MLAIGARAPEFVLPDQHGRLRRLTDLAGSAGTVLVFLPLAFSRTCTAELSDLRDNAELFAAAGLQVAGVTVDSKHVLRAWSDELGVGFPLLSDFWPHGDITRAFDAFRPDVGYPARATFLLDRDARVAAEFASPPGEARPISAYVEALSLVGVR